MPSSSSLKLIFVTAALSLFAVVVGCAEPSRDSTTFSEDSGSSITPVGDDDPNSTASPPQPAPATTSTPEPVDETEQAAVEIMWRMIGRFGDANKGAVIEAGHNGHLGLIPVLVEAAARTFDPNLAGEIANSLEKITGETVGGNFVLTGPWFQWMAEQDPPQEMLPGFDQWKGQLLATIDPSFQNVLYKDVPSEIPIWTVEWGGVPRDGIPPLEFPKTVAGDEVDFLNLTESVFGVEINGEARAYPHRILGWHELANDELGGELITFVF